MIRKSPTLGFNPGWLTTIAGGFATATVFLLIHVIADGIYRDASVLLVFLALAAFLAGVGAFCFWLARDERRRADAYVRRVKAHPDEPWLWPSDWAAGRITYSVAREAMRYWKFTAFYVVVAGAIFGIFRFIGTDHSLPWRLIPFVLPLIGLVLVVGSIVVTLRGRRFGASTLELATLPGAVGGRLAGRILGRLRTEDFATADRVGSRLRSTCSRYVFHRGTTSTGRTGTSSSSSSITETVVWQDQQVLRSLLPDGAGGSIIPVSFELPAEAPPTSLADGDAWVTWRLEADAKLVGPNYYADFEVPVFVAPRVAATAG